MSKKVHAPFTHDQCDSLNHYQFSGVMHPFTCPCDHPHTLLVALSDDLWVCPYETCGYTQDWAWRWMADWSWRELDAARWTPEDGG